MKVIYENLPLKTLTYVLDGLTPIIIYNYKFSHWAIHGEGYSEIIYRGLVRGLHKVNYFKTQYSDSKVSLDEFEHTKIRRINVREDGCVNIHLSVLGDKVESDVRSEEDHK